MPYHYQLEDHHDHWPGSKRGCFESAPRFQSAKGHDCSIHIHHAYGEREQEELACMHMLGSGACLLLKLRFTRNNARCRMANWLLMDDGKRQAFFPSLSVCSLMTCVITSHGRHGMHIWVTPGFTSTPSVKGRLKFK